jgi:hypothetical protein
VIGEAYFRALLRVGLNGQNSKTWIVMSFILLVYIRKERKRQFVYLSS